MMTRRIAIKRALLGVCGTAAAVGGSLEAQALAGEYASKAAMLAKVIEYIKWPDESPFQTIGIVGEDPFGDALIDNKLKFVRSKTVEGLKGCQLVFVPTTEAANAEAIFSSLGGASILTVGESEGFAIKGGMIGLIVEEGKVRFEVNTAAARRAGLLIDSRLLRLALHIFKD